jgi:putative membrane-bound dehydrogenase-like protein
MKLSLAALACAFTAPFGAAQIPQPTDAPKPRTPEESAAAFKVPEGFRLEVVASEPLIASPSAVAWDERGRLFVSELHGYNLAGELSIEELNKTGKLDTQVRRLQTDEKFTAAAKKGCFGALKLLSDSDGDGRMDKAVTWADALPPIYGMLAARGGMIVACAPDIVFLADPDGDGKAEVRETLFSGFRIGELERGINAPQWGADGWIYFGRGWGGGKVTGPHLPAPVELPGSDFRIRPDGSAIEPITGSTQTFGFAMAESGDRFTVTTTVPGIFVAPLPWRYLVRNPDNGVSEVQVNTGDKHAYSISKPHPWRQKRADDPEYFKYYNSRYGAAESEADGWFSAACGPMIYQDHVLPGLHGLYFVCEPSLNLIHRSKIVPDGSALTLQRVGGEEKSEFMASTDSWCHPMNLSHGPDGAIWMVDYYREIIEDYSAIPRHLQQQYGVYAGHDRGRIYRLSHKDSAQPQSADMSRLDVTALAQEIASPLLWRRQTAQRLLVEKAAITTATLLREMLSKPALEPAVILAALHTLDQLGVLAPADVQAFLNHAADSVRIHALQLADRWFAKEEGQRLLESVLALADSEKVPRVQIQIAMSLGEARDPRAFDTLVRYARQNLSVRWMDAAIVSSLHGRGVEMLAALITDPGAAAPLIAPLVASIAARRDETELAATLKLVLAAKPEMQASVLNGLALACKNMIGAPLTHADASETLAALTASTLPEVATAAKSLAASFVTSAAVVAAAENAADLTKPAMEVSDTTFRTFVTALNEPRNPARGHEIFKQTCIICHRIGDEGAEVGPDLLGQLGMGDESLLKEILMPSEHIRPGYETTMVQTHSGTSVVGLLKDDGATSLTLIQPGGSQQTLLRKDVASVRRLPASLMPSFAGLPPADVANVLAWLRSSLKSGTEPPKAQ